MILADAGIWIDFFRSGSSKAELEMLILGNQLVMHPYLVAELALGSLHDRRKTLAYLDRLPQIAVMTLAEVRHMIEARGLYSKGIGLTDAHIVAACLATPGTQLWTRDIRLAQVASMLGINSSLT